jgi:hypothetical protein
MVQKRKPSVLEKSIDVSNKLGGLLRDGVLLCDYVKQTYTDPRAIDEIVEIMRKIRVTVNGFAIPLRVGSTEAREVNSIRNMLREGDPEEDRLERLFDRIPGEDADKVRFAKKIQEATADVQKVILTINGDELDQEHMDTLLFKIRSAESFFQDRIDELREIAGGAQGQSVVG